MIYRYDIFANQHFPVGTKWTYEINIADEFYIGEEEIDTDRSSFFMTNEMLRIDDQGSMFVSIEFSKMHFGTLPEKLNFFLNKIVNVNQKFVLELNKNGQIKEVHLTENRPEAADLSQLFHDEFYQELSLGEKLMIDKNIERQDRMGFVKGIKKSLILMFCYPGYFRGGLSGEYAVETHNFTISSNFLTNVDWDVWFNMNIHTINVNKDVELICTGDVTQGTPQEESLLYQKIQNYFQAETDDVYKDYTFVVMGDYLLSSTDFGINTASINICETLNNEEIEFNKNIEIKRI